MYKKACKNVMERPVIRSVDRFKVEGFKEEQLLFLYPKSPAESYSEKWKNQVSGAVSPGSCKKRREQYGRFDRKTDGRT